MLFENGERFQAKHITPQEVGNCAFVPTVEFAHLGFKYVDFVCWHDEKRYEEPIPLVRSLLCLVIIIELYDQQNSILSLFKDLKSANFNLHKTRLKNHE